MNDHIKKALTVKMHCFHPHDFSKTRHSDGILIRSNSYPYVKTNHIEMVALIRQQQDILSYILITSDFLSLLHLVIVISYDYDLADSLFLTIEP